MFRPQLLTIEGSRYYKCRVQRKAPMIFSLGLLIESPATTYSPTHLRGQYHRR